MVLVSIVFSGSKGGLLDLEADLLIQNQDWPQTSAGECPLPLSAEIGDLGWQSTLLGLGIELGDQPRSSCAVLLQSLDSRASVSPHARYLAHPGGGAVSCMSQVPFWRALARVLCWCNAACLPAGDRLSRPIHHDGIELFSSALHNYGAGV